MKVIVPVSEISTSNLYEPGLYGILGPMFSGKTEDAIRRARRYVLAGVTVQAFKHEKDKRYNQIENMAGYDGGVFPAAPVISVEEMKECLNPAAQVIIVDETQFYDYQIIDFLSSLADEGKLVIYTALNTNFKGEPFKFVVNPSDLELLSHKTIADLMAISDGITLLNAVCRFEEDEGICGRPATRTQRLNPDGTPAHYDEPQFLIGSDRNYQARCRWHHFVPGKPKFYI